jgi:hypothetical protein
VRFGGRGEGDIEDDIEGKGDSGFQADKWIILPRKEENSRSSVNREIIQPIHFAMTWLNSNILLLIKGA